MGENTVLRRLVIGIYPVQRCTFYPVGSRAVLERHPVFHRPALFPTAQKSQHCTAQHPKGQYNKKNPGSFYAAGLFC